jgi:hypothetical protein
MSKTNLREEPMLETTAPEILEGSGQLERWDRPEKRHPVRYRFTTTSEILEKPGFPRVVVARHSSGDIVSDVGEHFPEGEYRLFAEDGEVLKVKNLGIVWAILAS